MNKIQLQTQITQLEQKLNNSNLTPQEKEKIKHWKQLLQKDLEKLN